jgi:hypothetical protein
MCFTSPQNRVNSRLLVVESQTANLTPDFSFGHNLCFKCPNGSCKPILDIYVLIDFQWYKELFNKMGFVPYNCSLKIMGVHRDSNFQHGSSRGSVSVHSHTLPHSQASLLARTLVSPCLGCEPKARVATPLLVTFGYWRLFHLMLLVTIIGYCRLFHLKLLLSIVDCFTLDYFWQS